MSKKNNKKVLKSIFRILPARLKKSLYTFIYPNGKPKIKILSAEENEKIRLEAMPRFEPTITNLLGKPLKVIDSVSFLFLFKEIFKLEIYKFNTINNDPYIT